MSDELLNICFQKTEEKTFTEELTNIHENLYEEQKDTIKTNYKNIDKNLRLSKGQLVTIAGRPGMGKSSVMGCLALSMEKVAFFSLEMQNKEIAYRMASSISNIPYQEIS
jgi:replicative DNA helicase